MGNFLMDNIRPIPIAQCNDIAIYIFYVLRQGGYET